MAKFASPAHKNPSSNPPIDPLAAPQAAKPDVLFASGGAAPQQMMGDQPAAPLPSATIEVDPDARRKVWAKKINEKMPFLTIGKCSSCGATILWGKTPDGKNMPLDPAERPLSLQVIDAERGIVETRKALASHWSTCATADQHRKPKEEKPA